MRPAVGVCAPPTFMHVPAHSHHVQMCTLQRVPRRTADGNIHHGILAVASPQLEGPSLSSAATGQCNIATSALQGGWLCSQLQCDVAPPEDNPLTPARNSANWCAPTRPFFRFHMDTTLGVRLSKSADA